MKILGLLLTMLPLLSWAEPENALAFVERRTAEILKIDRSQVGEWNKEKGFVSVVGIAALKNKTPEEIIAKRHELAEVALMDAKLRLAEKLGFSLSAEEKRHLWGDSAKDTAGITATSKIQFLARHQILGSTVLLQAESNLDGEYLMAVSLIWSKGLQKSAQEIMSGRGSAKAEAPGKYSLKQWMSKTLDLSQVVGPRQYVDNQGKRHFIAIVSMPCGKADPPKLNRMLRIKGAAAVAWALRSDVETSSVSTMMMNQTSVGDAERTDVSSELTQRIRQRLRSAVPPVKPLLGDSYVVREHPLFPGSKMAVFACELDGEFSEYQYK